MSLILHHCHEARSMRVLWLLNELGLDFDLKIYPFAELRQEAYLKLHPLARVPALQHNDLVLYESGAILQYLCETFSPNELGRAAGNDERPLWLQWLHFSETLAVHGASLVQQNLVIQPPEVRSETVKKLELRRLEKGLELLDRHLQHSCWLLSSFSAVDIAVGYSVHLARFFTDIKQFEALSNYYESLSQRPAFKASLPEEGDPLAIFKQSFIT